MKIYKFKDLSDDKVHSHFFQILFENKIWCASPESLNDPEEFQFKIDYCPSERTEFLLGRMIEKLGRSKIPPKMVAAQALRNNRLEKFAAPLMQGIVETCRSTIGVTSFTCTYVGAELWEKYGGSGNGVVLEFEVLDSSIGNMFHHVEYVLERIFHLDIFIESQIGDSLPIFKKILCTKTQHWAHEQEIRFLGKNSNINFTLECPITKVILGDLVSSDIVNRVMMYCEHKSINVERMRISDAE